MGDWKYWKICQISPANNLGYEYRSLSDAREFFEVEFSNSVNQQDRQIQNTLLSYFYAQDCSVNTQTRSLAGLCLRSYVSFFICSACRRTFVLFNSRFQFNSRSQFIYEDWLGRVLDDDGRRSIVLDRERQNQLIVTGNATTQETSYRLFTVEILRTYNQQSSSSMSLKNWIYRKTKQRLLSEFQLQNDWAVIIQASKKQRESLFERELDLVTVFYEVYRRDRRRSQQKGRYSLPNQTQLQEMLGLLLERGIIINSTEGLLEELSGVANRLRNIDTWDSLEINYPDGDETWQRSDLSSYNDNNLLVSEERELIDFLQREFLSALVTSIETVIENQIARLEKSTRYAPFAAKFLPGLELYYCQGMSIFEIMSRLEIESRDRAKRILKLKDSLDKVKFLTEQRLLDSILVQAQKMGLATIPPEPNYLNNLIEDVENFVKTEFYLEAAAELFAGKTSLRNSLYARQICFYLNERRGMNSE